MPLPDPAAVVGALPVGTPVAVVRHGRAWVVAAGVAAAFAADGVEALAGLDRLAPGWWAGSLSYDLGRAIEAVPERAAPDPAIPDVVLVRFGARLTLDPDRGTSRIEGDGPGRALLGAALAHPVPPAPPEDLGPARTSLDRVTYEAGVHHIVERIAAGDCYQVNLTRRLSWSRPVDPVALFAALVRANPAPHATLLVLPTPTATLAVVSASPERFLARAGRDVETRPIKGTHVDADALVHSAKDRAENVMIVDLARNDLGRVCEPGSVHVPALCALETHPGLHHLVSTVRGRLRPDVGFGGLVRATFPPASVTGAPKPAVLRVIEELEPVRRGVYCGAVGWIDTERDACDLALAIRTFTIDETGTALGVGSGITYDSDAAAEWAETELKAARLLAATGATEAPSRDAEHRRGIHVPAEPVRTSR